MTDEQKTPTPRGPGRGGVIVTPNPYVWSSGPDSQGREVRVSYAWLATTRLLTTISLHRDPGCDFTHIYVGVGSDGSPNSSERSFDLSGFEGDVTVLGQQLTWLASHGLASIDDVLGLQVTAV